MQAGKLTEAVLLIRRAMVIDPQNALYHRNVGEICRRLGRNKEAIFFGQEATRLAPSDADAFYNLGLALRDGNRLDEALIALRETVVRNPQHVQAWEESAQLLQKMGYPDEAQQAFAASQEAGVRSMAKGIG